MTRTPLRRPPKHTPVLVKSALERLGSRVIKARKIRDMTQEQLAHLSDVSLSTLRSIESGSDGVSVGNLLKILQGLRLLDQVEELLDPKHDREVVAFVNRHLEDR